MVNFYELEQFVTFYHTGTLAGAAEQLSISRPTLTRNMQKIEAEFNVTLFQRTKNSICLTDNGILAAQQAELILQQYQEMLNRVRTYDRMNHTITLGSCAPIPIFQPHQILSSLYPDVAITSEIKSPADLQCGLNEGLYQLIILPALPEGTDYCTKQLGGEHLLFSLPISHRFADRESLSFEEMNGENMLLYNEIGFWHDIVTEKMPDSRFLVQTEQYTFGELIENSLLACFATDITATYYPPKNRVNIPIADPEANVSYYLVCKKENRKRFAPLFA